MAYHFHGNNLSGGLFDKLKSSLDPKPGPEEPPEPEIGPAKKPIGPIPKNPDDYIQDPGCSEGEKKIQCPTCDPGETECLDDPIYK
jgi:hypothetical protein